MTDTSPGPVDVGLSDAVVVANGKLPPDTSEATLGNDDGVAAGLHTTSLTSNHVKDMIGGTKPIEQNPFFYDTVMLATLDKERMANHVRYKRLPNCVVECSIAEVVPIFRAEDDALHWVGGKGPEDLVQSFISRLGLPSHFHPAIFQSFSHAIRNQTKRGRPSKTKDVVVGQRGYCSARNKCSCPTSFVFGLTQEEALKCYTMPSRKTNHLPLILQSNSRSVSWNLRRMMVRLVAFSAT